MNKKLILSRWEGTGLLEGMVEDKKADLALVMHNQVELNESLSFSARFKRLSIPLVRRILGATPFDFCASLFSEKEFGNPVLTNIPFLEKDTPSINTKDLLDAEAEYCAVLTSEVAGWLANWCAQNNTKCFNIKAFGVQDGHIAIYGLENNEKNC